LIWLMPVICVAEEAYQRVQVTAPYIEMHTGPGSSYPVIYVAERMEWVEIRKRRTDWFQVFTRRGRSGWVSLEQMRQTQTSDGEPLQLASYSQDDFRARDWEFGFYGGDMEGATLLGLYGGYSFNENLSTEVSFS
jgi:hypothetical protein